MKQRFQRWLLASFLWVQCVTLLADSVAQKVVLRERVDPGRVMRTASALTADGMFLLDPAADPSQNLKPEDVKPESLKVQVQARLVVQDRWQLADQADSATAGVLMSRRLVESAETVLGGQIRGGKHSLSPDRKRFLVDIHDELVRHGSLDGALTRQELEALTMPADGITLWTLLPRAEVMVGDTYPLDNLAAKSLSLFDSIAVNGATGKVTKLDDGTVEIELSGEIRGAVLGAEGKMTIQGRLTFNRNEGFVDFLRLERDESRRPGNVEAGLEIHSKLEVRRFVMPEVVPELADKADENWPKSIDSKYLTLEWKEPSGLFKMTHDRDWHVTWSDTRESVIKRVDKGGSVIAQCNLKKGTPVQPGRHQDPQQFREDVQNGLGNQFRRFFGEGVLERTEEEGFGYKLAVEGVIQDLPVAWYYYLMASSDGNQYLATVTTMLSETQSAQKTGLALVETLRWIPQTGKPEPKTGPVP